MNDAPELTCDQVDRFKRERHFALSRGRFLHVEIKGRRRQWAYVLDLLALSPRSRRRLRVGWPGPAAVLGGVALLWAAWALWEGGALGGGYASLIGLAGAGLGAVGAALLADT
ncbi:MAG: hypothetical protein GWO02_08575, partial [Gammaproteobacteria bacterium]|nr:hypothetical protein [Gammaproteobacteria bacterium]